MITTAKKTMENSHNQELLKTQKDFMLKIENIYGNMREFRHEYNNMFAAVYGYVEREDISGLSAFLTTHVVPLGKSMNSTNSTIDSLKSIDIPEMRGLMILKMMEALDLGIDVQISVTGVIDSIKFDPLSLITLIGNLLDNAKEACLETSYPYIKLVVEKSKSDIIIVIANSYKGDAPSLDEIFKKGYSTKGEGRGLGLDTVRQITGKAKNVFLSTYTNNGEFVQELVFSDKTKRL